MKLGAANAAPPPTHERDITMTTFIEPADYAPMTLGRFYCMCFDTPIPRKHGQRGTILREDLILFAGQPAEGYATIEEAMAAGARLDEGCDRGPATLDRHGTWKPVGKGSLTDMLIVLADDVQRYWRKRASTDYTEANP